MILRIGEHANYITKNVKKFLKNDNDKGLDNNCISIDTDDYLCVFIGKQINRVEDVGNYLKDIKKTLNKLEVKSSNIELYGWNDIY